MDPQFITRVALIAADKLDTMSERWWWLNNSKYWERVNPNMFSDVISPNTFPPDEFAIQKDMPSWIPLSARTKR